MQYRYCGKIQFLKIWLVIHVNIYHFGWFVLFYIYNILLKSNNILFYSTPTHYVPDNEGPLTSRLERLAWGSRKENDSIMSMVGVRPAFCNIEKCKMHTKQPIKTTKKHVLLDFFQFISKHRILQNPVSNYGG